MLNQKSHTAAIGGREDGNDRKVTPHSGRRRFRREKRKLDERNSGSEHIPLEGPWEAPGAGPSRPGEPESGPLRRVESGQIPAEGEKGTTLKWGAIRLRTRTVGETGVSGGPALGNPIRYYAKGRNGVPTKANPGETPTNRGCKFANDFRERGYREPTYGKRRRRGGLIIKKKGGGGAC